MDLRWTQGRLAGHRDETDVQPVWLPAASTLFFNDTELPCLVDELLLKAQELPRRALPEADCAAQGTSIGR